MIKHIILPIIILFIMVNTAMACQCLPDDEKLSKDAWKETNFVVKARVLSISGGWNGLGPRTRIEIMDKIKGDDIPDTILVNYNDNAMACGHQLYKGQERLFALYDTRDVGVTDTNLRGFGFRMTNLCHHKKIEFYMNNMMDDTPSSVMTKTKKEK